MKFQLFCASIIVFVVAINASPYPKYKGCFKDGDPRDLSQKVFHKGQSVRGCVKKCGALKFMYAGVQFSYLCFCGNYNGRYGRLPDSACNSPCRKKRDKICGGEWANAVYDTGYRSYKPKKWLDSHKPAVDNTTAHDGSGGSAQEITQESSAEETSADEGIPDSKAVPQALNPQGSAVEALASLGEAAQMIASLGTSPKGTLPQGASSSQAAPSPQAAQPAQATIPQIAPAQASVSPLVPAQAMPSLGSAAQILAALGSAPQGQALKAQE